MITQKILFIILLFTQILLFSSYYYIIPKYNLNDFWGNISQNKWNYYLRIGFYSIYIKFIIIFIFQF